MSVKNRKKVGSGWKYDEDGITYDEATDPISGLPVYYNALGESTTFINRTKNAA